MSRGNFRRDLSRSEEAVHALAEHYRSNGFEVKEFGKELQSFGDISVEFEKGGPTNIEVKFDIMAARTGNLCFEMSNGSKETGIMTTKADLVYYVMPDKNGKTVFVFDTCELREWIQNPLNVKIKSGGDKKKFILAIASIESIRNSTVLESEFSLA